MQKRARITILSVNVLPFKRNQMRDVWYDNLRKDQEAILLPFVNFTKNIYRAFCDLERKIQLSKSVPDRTRRLPPSPGSNPGSRNNFI